ENAKNVGNYLLNQLKSLPTIKEVRGRGLMIGIEFDFPIKDIRNRLLFDKHIFTGASGSNTIRLLPPLCLSQNQADKFLNAFSEIIITLT
ncbi:MAG: aminotransferase class III-fold pyridoxal phosphate-dependent enzyme, partial [Paludibacter sp.]|nr:aminotransferase class III-fold pyridoxal phosphate-dependent enzyme [Paludibacter sp.]